MRAGSDDGRRTTWVVTLAAAAILMVTMGARQSLGLFISPLKSSTWLATVPPTATIVGKLFGIRYLSTLFGLTLLSHQIGGFLGAYLGGIALVRFGNYHWMWYADMALAAAAAIINLPIREALIMPAPAVA